VDADPIKQQRTKSLTTILIGGDICPIGRNYKSFVEGDASVLFNDLLSHFRSYDLTIVNLECPIIKKWSPIAKSGPSLGIISQNANALKNAYINVVNLANNHILDHGPEGLENTISLCREAGLSTVGAGENLAQAGENLLCKIDNLTVGIMAYAEHECSIATKTSSGANPLNLMDYVRKIRDLKRNTDYIIVLLHAGKEYYLYPSPQLQQICRFMIEEGANLVVCQHSHCAGAYEKYQGGHIIYGQGNLIFDAYPRIDNLWCRGYLVKILISNQGSDMEIVPFIQSDNQIGARRMSRENESDFLKELEEKSGKIKDVDFVEKEWALFCKRLRYNYFSIFRGHGRLLRFFNRLFHFSDLFYSKYDQLVLQNIVRCESHREAIITILSSSESEY